MLDDFTYGVWVFTFTHIPPNIHSNYSSISENLEASLFELNLLEQKGKTWFLCMKLMILFLVPLRAMPQKNSEQVCIIHDLLLFMNDNVVDCKVSCSTIYDILPHIKSSCWI